ncbi:MAG: hypothetical protein FWG99_10975 [Treponema sp.]|nr:hypothetical protein [Treponema sp.]
MIRIIGIVLLIVGLVVLVLGAYNLISYNTSTGGKVANRIAGAFGSRTKAVQNYLVQIGIGVACAAVGFVLFKKS